jgi:hypothetical protein
MPFNYATQTLPETHTRRTVLDLSGKLPLLLMNLVSLLTFALFFMGFLRLAAVLRPQPISSQSQITSLQSILLLLITLAAFITLHELCHGLFLWLFTRHRPQFGFKVVYAYAAAPDWYLPRNQHIVTALAPLVGISLFGIALMPMTPPVYLPFLLFCLSFNTAGAIGDGITVIWEFTKSPHAYIRDTGPTCECYEPT